MCTVHLEEPFPPKLHLFAVLLLILINHCNIKKQIVVTQKTDVMQTCISAVLFTLLFTQCKKDNDLDKHAKTLQGSWRLEHSVQMDGIAYPPPGSLTVVKFEDYNMLTYAHDTLLKTEKYGIIMQKDPVSTAQIPSVVFKNSPYSGSPLAISIHNDTLVLFILHTSDGGSKTYTRIKI
jgi:hypothetical protein